MQTQNELIGNHPLPENHFGRAFTSVDEPITATQRHRSLAGQVSATDVELVDWLAQRLIEHHYDDLRLEKLKARYGTLGFTKFAEQFRKLPRVDKVKKGNATEILLIEYLKSCQSRPLIKMYRFRYNGNVDQSMKGDDALLLDLFQGLDGTDQLRVFMGEAKFRTSPDRTVITDVCASLGKDKSPLSYTLLLDILARESEDNRLLVERLENFMIDEIKRGGNLIYAGLLLSNTRASQTVRRYMSSDNEKFVFISMGINQPADLINASFLRAEELVRNPAQI